MATKLTEAQRAAARAQLDASAAQEEKTRTDQILFEAKRDELAYSLMQKARAEKKPISFGDAQTEATKQLGTPTADPVQPARTIPAESTSDEAPARKR